MTTVRQFQFTSLLLAAIAFGVLAYVGSRSNPADGTVEETPAISVATTETFRPEGLDDNVIRDRTAARGTFPTTSAPIRTFPRPTFVAE